MFPRCVSSIVSWRSVAVLALLAFLLQVTSFILSWQLTQRQQSVAESVAGNRGMVSSGVKVGTRGHRSMPYQLKDFHLGQKFSDDHQNMLKRIAHWSVLDGSGEFRVAVGVVQGSRVGAEEGESWPSADSRGLTLVTQCSLSRLARLPHLAAQWQGPLSIAVFALSGEVQAAVQTFHLLRKCYPDVHHNVTFSLVFPLNSPTFPHLTPTPDTTPCHRIFPQNQQENYSFSGLQYPNNLLRNVARKASGTSFILVIDMDMTPSAGLQAAFLEYATAKKLYKANSEEDKTVWVVPAYEIKENLKIPETKSELLRMKGDGVARPFYQELCLKCQRFTDYTAWEKNGLEEGGALMPLYEVLWQDPWEPFYIAYRNIPPYDERFRQYGFNRISQVCELHIAGYKFMVLNSAFVVHEGFKTAEGFHKTKDMEQERNRILFRQFKTELKAKYPESSRRCY